MTWRKVPPGENQFQLRDAHLEAENHARRPRAFRVLGTLAGALVGTYIAFNTPGGWLYIGPFASLAWLLTSPKMTEIVFKLGRHMGATEWQMIQHLDGEDK